MKNSLLKRTFGVPDDLKQKTGKDVDRAES
jgi:hypothetical protein